MPRKRLSKTPMCQNTHVVLSQQAEVLKHEAAARLAKILTSAEHAAEWTAVRPDATPPQRFRMSHAMALPINWAAHSYLLLCRYL